MILFTGLLFFIVMRNDIMYPYNNGNAHFVSKVKRKTLQNCTVCNASHPLFDCVMDIHSSPVSTSLTSFAVALTIRNPISLISSRRLSSCLRCVNLSVSLFGKKNWSTDTSKKVTSSYDPFIHITSLICPMGYGEDFIELILNNYPQAESLIPRARFYVSTFADHRMSFQ